MRRINEGEDVELDEEEVPYIPLGNLGFGAHGFVEKVKDITTGQCYARKSFRVDRGSLNQSREILRREVQIIRELASHPHVIRVHSTYITGRTLAMVLTPVADEGDLAQYLAEFRDLTMPDEWLEESDMRNVLYRAFGCLSHCLAYMHSNKFVDSGKPIIRHKDIKPKNILIHQGIALFTDFGISTRCTEGATTTGGRPDMFSARYCAPEVADNGERDRKADIFSLGCVFLEILDALYLTHDVSDYLTPDSRPYHENIEAIQAAIEKGSDVSDLVLGMLNRDPSTRPTAREVATVMHITDDIHCKRCSGENCF